ncbi:MULTISPECIES: hypothetical protein [unclassified Chryseobacterium]|uniref:hypothetical protein n=1 Tax=unclassified Chryseobacterium TaxID=2593645 RepID=UPI00226A337D|nr:MULTISPECIES: hypothetical protein [unclassified Chryseobacterium]
MKDLLNVVYLFLAGIVVIYLIFFHNSPKLLYKEKCPCDKNLTLLQYSKSFRRDHTKYYIFKIIDEKDKVISESKAFHPQMTRYTNPVIRKKYKSIFYWDCKNRQIDVGGDILSFSKN